MLLLQKHVLLQSKVVGLCLARGHFGFVGRGSVGVGMGASLGLKESSGSQEICLSQTRGSL